MNDFLNPYIAGAPVVEPSMFFGRQDVFDWIEQNLSGRFVNHILVIHGQRRVGKTSVLKQIPNHLPTQFIHIFIDLQGRTHTSLDRFQWWLAREICRAVSQAGRESIPIPEHELFAQDGEYLAATFLPGVLSKLGEAILLLTFDEFDTLSEPEIQQSLTRPLIAYLRRLFDLPNLNFIFSIGSSGHKLENMQASYTEFFKTALYRKISFLKQEDCSQLITCPVEGMLTYETAAVERIYNITSGHPYFTQLICHELFSLSQKTGRRTLTREDVESVLEDVIERGTVNLKFVWDEASDLEKWVLSSLAHELQAQELDLHARGVQSKPACNDKQLAAALHNQRVRYSENDLNTALVHLREKDVLTQENRFVVELLCIWLLKNRPLDRVREELVQVNPIANRYNEIGDEFRELGQLEKALDSFRQALSTDPSNLRAQVSIATLHLEGGNYDQAVQGYEAALRMDDDDIAARGGLSMALMAMGEAATSTGNLAEAEKYYQRILTDNPDHPEAHQRMAALYALQADEALAAGNPELALQHYARALEHTPEDNQLAARYAHAKEEHTAQLVDGLLKQSQQAQERQDWAAALDAIQRALQLIPNEPTLLKRLAEVKEAPRLAQISSLSAHAQDMERSEHWDEAVQDWETCLQLHPEDEEGVRQSLEHARRWQKIAGDYTQAQAAIKQRRYSQAIALLQGVIAQDASYKDAAVLLVECLKVRPKRELKLPKLPMLPIRSLRWVALGLVLVAVIVGIATQWSRLSPMLAGIVQPKTPNATQAAGTTPPATQTAGDIPQPTATAFSQEMQSLSWWIEKMTGGKAPDFQDDFSSTTLGEYWNKDDGAKKATLQDGALRLYNGSLIGDDVLKKMNYILQVDLRFGGFSKDDNFVYGMRVTGFQNGKYGTEYQLNINPSSGEWMMNAITDPYGQYVGIQKGNLGVIEAGRWYELGIVVNTDSIRVFWDDQLLLTQESVELYGLMNHFGLYASSGGEATLDIDNWRLFDLGSPAYMRNDWVTKGAPTVGADNFVQGEGWQFNPLENEKYENGKAVLFTNVDETKLSREDLQGSNIAMEVTFSPRDMPESASIVWFLGADLSTGEMFTFDYFPANGSWAIMKSDGQEFSRIASGWAQPTPNESTGMIMVVINGNRISAFQDGIFLGSVVTDRPGTGMATLLSVRSKGAPNAQVDILKIGFWNLNKVEWMTDDWMTARPETVVIDSFTGKEGLKFDPAENEKYEDGRAVVYTDGIEAGLTRNDLQGTNFALEVSIVPWNMPDSAYVVWILGIDNANTRHEVIYSPKTGAWQICKVENEQWQELSSGMAQTTPEGNSVTFMVVKDGNQVRVFMNQVYIGSADLDPSITGIDNWLVVRDKKQLFARYDVYLIRFWGLGTAEGVSGEGSDSFAKTTDKMTGGRSPDFQDDFSSTTLGEYWNTDDGAKNATLLDGALRLNNVFPIGKGTLPVINYLLKVDLRFGGLAGDENFNYYLRGTTTPYVDLVSGYQLTINPSKGTWLLMVMTDPNGKYIEVQKGNLGAIAAGRWYELGIVMMNETFWVYWDNQLLITQNNVNLFGTNNCFGLDHTTAGEATLDIDNWRFWDLGVPASMRSDWITSATPTVLVDNFMQGEGWLFNPAANGNYDNGKAVLFTEGGETFFSRDDFQGTNIAMEVSFSPQNMPETASLVWFLGADKASGKMFTFDYFPTTGFWAIMKSEGQQFDKLVSGWTETTPHGSIGIILVVMEGDRVSVFYGGALLGYVESSRPGTGMDNSLSVRSGGAFYAQIDILKIHYWNMDKVEWKTDDWITARPETVVIDSFTGNESMWTSPEGNVKYENGMMVAFTDAGETYFRREDLFGKNFALELTFSPVDMSNSGVIMFQMIANEGPTEYVWFMYNPITGDWKTHYIKNQQEQELAAGGTLPTPNGSNGAIMFVINNDQACAYLNSTSISWVKLDRSGAGETNTMGVASWGGGYVEADILKIRFWNLDQ